MEFPLELTVTKFIFPELILNTSAASEPCRLASLRKHPFLLASPAAKSEEKRMFSQAITWHKVKQIVTA